MNIRTIFLFPSSVTAGIPDCPGNGPALWVAEFKIINGRNTGRNSELAIGQAANGMMYFANNDGLVEYDGSHWSVYRDMDLIYRSLCLMGTAYT
jgi:hypothetical protein